MNARAVLLFSAMVVFGLLAACWPLLRTLVLAWWWRHRAFAEAPED